MRLLWTCIASSELYTRTAGVMEMLAGFLVICPRTWRAGALLSIGIMSHVLLLNLSFDVPVKLYSGHLLAMAVILAWPDLWRIGSMVLFNARVEPALQTPLFASIRRNNWVALLQILLAFYLSASWLYAAYGYSTAWGARAPEPPLFGIWKVEEFELHGKAHPPLTTDQIRWQRVVFDRPEPRGNKVYLQQMDSSFDESLVHVDIDNKKIHLKDKDVSLDFERTPSGGLVLSGQWQGKHLRAKLVREEPKFLLTSQKFRWIIERPLIK